VSNEELSKELKDEIYGLALKNAVEHGGKALPGPVISKFFGRHPELRSKAKLIVQVVRNIVSEVNKLSLDDQIKLLKEKFPELMEEKLPKEERRGLPPLPNVSKYKVIVTRFAPNPDFLIHLGNARPAILSHEYARMYKGKMILRFEDTDPKNKAPLPEAYEMIKEDLAWLGIKWDEEYIQSLRLNLFYDIAKEIIKRGGAYVDLCTQNEFRKYKLERKPCPHRNQDINKNLELFDKMIEGYFSEGEAVLRIKTDINYPDPSVVDWVAFRIIDTDKHPHPIVGSKYIVWPTYNFAAAVDDHLMGVTHILRGKEHAVNTVKQKFLYEHLGWEYPEVVNLGRLKLEGFILSKSKIKELLSKYSSKFKGPDDPRFGTIASLRSRGIEPEAIRQLIMEIGVKEVDASISWDNLSAINRKIIDPKVKRVMVIREPVKLIVENYRGPDELSLPYHPDNKVLGYREIKINKVGARAEFYIEKEDIKHLRERGGVRLMECCNVRLLSINEAKNEVKAEYIGKDLTQAKDLRFKIIHWLPTSEYVNVNIIVPEGLKLKRVKALGEISLRNSVIGERYQFIRYGFFKVERVRERDIVALFIHE